MTYEELDKLGQGLQSVQNLPGEKFAYAVAKNMVTISNTFKRLGEMLKADKDYTPFDKERVELCRTHAIKDKDGNPIMENGAYTKMISQKHFNKDFDKLKQKYKEPFEKQEAKVKAYQAKMNEEVGDLSKLHKITKENLPPNITPGQIFNIMPLIEE